MFKSWFGMIGIIGWSAWLVFSLFPFCHKGSWLGKLRFSVLKVTTTLIFFSKFSYLRILFTLSTLLLIVFVSWPILMLEIPLFSLTIVIVISLLLSIVTLISSAVILKIAAFPIVLRFGIFLPFLARPIFKIVSLITLPESIARIRLSFLIISALL